MGASSGTSLRPRRVPKPLFWGAGGVGVCAIGVEISRTGLDVLLFLLAILAIITLERTIGDWLGEMLGSGIATVVLGTILGAAAWLTFEEGGAVDRFFAAAERRGYGTSYYETSISVPPASSPVTPVASTGAGPAASERPRHHSAASASARSRADPDGPAKSAAQSTIRGTDGLAGWLAGHRRAVASVRLSVPTPAVTGERLTIVATVTSNGAPVSNETVVFTVEGRRIAAASTGRDGTASAAFSPRVPGAYHVRAELQPGDRFNASAAGARLVVLSGGR